MSRAVVEDHVMFNECIALFRPTNLEEKNQEKKLFGYLLLDFRLTEELIFSNFKIEPSIEVRLPGAYAAFISRVTLPNWFEQDHNAHLFTIGLAAVISFVLGRPVKAPRDGYPSRREEIDEHLLSKLSIQFPVLTAGPGLHDITLSQQTLEKLKVRIQETVHLLFDIPYEKYVKVMQSIRLIQLAHLNKRDDFGLGYYLLVSAIEPIATEAIKRKSVVNKNQLKDEWKELAKTDEEFKKLLQVYQQELSKNRYIGKRIVEFIMKYCPPKEWYDLEHPQENLINYAADLTGHKQDWVTEKHWYETYPEDLNEQEIRKLLADVYTHRSKFTHEGENPPHNTPNSHNRFFDKEMVVKEENGNHQFEEIILPNFQLISFIATRSILNYLKDK